MGTVKFMMNFTPDYKDFVLLYSRRYVMIKEVYVIAGECFWTG